MFDRELPTLEFILALHGVGAGARHRNADGHRRTGRAGRPGADRRLVVGEGRHDQPARQHHAADQGRAALQQGAARYRRIQFLFKNLLHRACSSQMFMCKLSSSPKSDRQAAALVSRRRSGYRYYKSPSSQICQCHFRRRERHFRRKIRRLSGAVRPSGHHCQSGHRTFPDIHRRGGT